MSKLIYIISDNTPENANLREHSSSNNYTTVHDDTVGGFIGDSGSFIVGQWKGVPSGLYEVYRSVVTFETSMLEGLTPIAASVIFYHAHQNQGIIEQYLHIVDGNSVSSPLIASDYHVLLSATDFGNIYIEASDELWGLPENQLIQKIVELNASGIAALVLDGFTHFGLRDGRDISSTPPTGPNAYNNFDNPFQGTVQNRFIQIQSVIPNFTSALVIGIMTPYEGYNCNPILLKVEVSEGSGAASNWDTRLRLYNTVTEEDIYSPWNDNQAPFEEFSYEFTDLAQNTIYRAYVQWSRHGSANVYNSSDYYLFRTRPAGLHTSSLPQII